MNKKTVLYQPGDRIFAKVKGHPHWPARINLLPEDVTVPKGKYPIFFYGTYEVYFLTPKDIFPYEKWKHKYALPKPRPVFQKGLEEIEKNPDVLLYGKDPNAIQFLSQFYQFRKTNLESNLSSVKTLEHRSSSSSPVDAKPVSPSSSVLSTPLQTTETKTLNESPKQTKKGILNTFSNSELPAKRKAIATPTPTNPEKVSKLENTKETKSLQPKKRVSDTGERHVKNENEVKQKFTPTSSIVQPIKIRQKMLHSSSPTEVSTQLEKSCKATTALGRPMRKSASQFSSRHLLNSTEFKNLDNDSDEDSSEDADWKPSLCDSGATSPSVPTLYPLSKQSSPPEILMRHTDQQKKKTSLVSSTTQFACIRKPQKPSNVSLSPEDLNTFSKRPNHTSCQKQLKELSTEAKLLLLHRGIKSSLILGHENIPACLKRLESLEKMDITLPVLVKCGTVIATIRKCCRYTRSLDVKIAARKVFNRFLKLMDNATQEELDLAHTELMENNRRMDNDSSTASRPQTVADLFQFKPPPLFQSVVEPSPPPPPPDPVHIHKSSPLSASPQLFPNTASPSLSTSQSEVTSTAKNFTPPPPPQPPLPEQPPVKEENGAEFVFTHESLPENTKSPTSDSESEGLAPSLGGQDGGEESDDSEEMPLFRLHSRPSNGKQQEQQQQSNVEATLAAVKQAFLLHSQIKQKQLQEQQKTAVSQAVPPSIIPQQTDTSRAYVPQSLHPCTVPPPSYVPCLSAGAPVLPPALALPLPQQFVPTMITPPIPNAFSQYRPSPTDFYHHTPDLSRPPPSTIISPQPPPVIATTPPMPTMRCSESGGSYDEVVRPQRPRERASSPHALPHPLEHYQKCLSSALGSEHTMVAPPISDDLDTRIAKILKAAAPRPHILSPPPPPPPLPSSQNLLLCHRPPGVAAEGIRDTFRPQAPLPQFGHQLRPQLHPPTMPSNISYTPTSPIQQDQVPGDFDPLQKNFMLLPPNPNQQQPQVLKDAKAPDDVYSLLGI